VLTPIDFELAMRINDYYRPPKNTKQQQKKQKLVVPRSSKREKEEKEDTNDNDVNVDDEEDLLHLPFAPVDDSWDSEAMYSPDKFEGDIANDVCAVCLYECVRAACWCISRDVAEWILNIFRNSKNIRKRIKKIEFCNTLKIWCF
jgi:hypothetical protein